MASSVPPETGKHLEPLTYKRWILKVSIHCEGCRRKVKKVLHRVEGVYNVDIETKQQKVVVTGNVEAETLIKKLTKSGKHAELWPEIAEQKEKKTSKSKKKEKQSDPESNTKEPGHGGPDVEKQAAKIEVVKESRKTSEGGGGGGGAVKFSDSVDKISGGSGGGQVLESKSEGKKPETSSLGNHSPAADKDSSESDEGAEKRMGGNSGKKKTKQAQKSATEIDPSSGGGSAGTGSPNRYAGPPPVNLSPPRHHGNQYPPHYYAPPPPVYAVSQSTVYPSSSYTTSYYATPPPQPPHSYAYTYPSPHREAPPSHSENWHPGQPLDSFEIFSDENPNGCSIM